ncbi:MAG: ATP-binding protein [Cyanobacteria bacterium]|nr:ATP-binding protein [Cyanobacteriota bacterium]
MPDFRQPEIDLVCSAIDAKQSLLLIGKTGEGKSHFAEKVDEDMSARGWVVWRGRYEGQAKSLLESIAVRFDIPTTIEVSEGRERPMTALQLKKEIADNVCRPNWLLIFDDADRLPVSFRYWLEELHREDTRLLLVSAPPLPKDIFLKLVRIEMRPFEKNFLRTLMVEESIAQGVQISPAQLADFESRVGSNPALAKRIVSEQRLGLVSDKEGDRTDYIDGTPFVLAILAAVSIVRFVGLGLGDRSLYIIGGMAMVTGMTIKILYAAANKRNRRLGA